MSGERVIFVGEAMATIVRSIPEVRALIDAPPVIVGGLAVLARLSRPYRATTDLDIVDRLRAETPHLQILRAADGATTIEPAAVLLPTPLGPVKVDVLEVRQVELDHPSDDPGDRLHASAHAWAHDSATDVTIAAYGDGTLHEVTTLVAEPGPLIGMKLQAVMNRTSEKQGTDLLDIVRLALDPSTRPKAMAQIGSVDPTVAVDIELHANYWFARQVSSSLTQILAAGGTDISRDDLDVVAELLGGAAARR